VAFDAFISYASPDKTVADAVCARLENSGIRCWIAPRDVTPGMNYGTAIGDAIREARVMVLVFSSSANKSPQVPREVERAVSLAVPIIPFRIENVAPEKPLDYFISSVHWLDAMTPPMERHIDSLATTVRKLLAPPPRPAAPPPPPVARPVAAAPVAAPAPRPNVAASAAPAARPAAQTPAARPPQKKKGASLWLIGLAVILAQIIRMLVDHYSK
jgi:hypothetical protein